MNLQALHVKFAPLGTLSRKVFNLTSGMLAGETSVSVRMSLISSERSENISDTMQFTESRLRISKAALEAVGFPVPPQDGDVFEVAGVKGTIRTCHTREYLSQVVYACRVEITNE